jgi:hypothetical protein
MKSKSKAEAVFTTDLVRVYCPAIDEPPNLGIARMAVSWVRENLHLSLQAGEKSMELRPRPFGSAVPEGLPLRLLLPLYYTAFLS